MNKVLLRPLFRKKYLEKMNKKNSLSKGGLLNIKKFQEGGLSETEKRNITLAPITASFLGAMRRPGESEFSAVARALGTGVATIPETKKTIAAIEQTMAPKEKFKILTKEEIEAENLKGANLDPRGTYQKNLATQEIKDISKRQLFADPFKSEMAKDLSKSTLAAIDAGSKAQTKLKDLEIIEKLVSNPDLTLGQFGPLTQSIQKFAVGLGADEKGLTDLTAAEVLQRFAGQKVLSDLGQLKGALSEKELAFIQSLNLGVDTPREAAILVTNLYQNAAKRAIEKARITNQHISQFGNPLTADSDGKTLLQKISELEADFQILTPEIEARLSGFVDGKSTEKVDTQFQRDIITMTSSNADIIKRKFPDAKIGDQFEIRGDTLVKVKK